MTPPLEVEVGQTVEVGDTLGYAGDTGCATSTHCTLKFAKVIGFLILMNHTL